MNLNYSGIKNTAEWEKAGVSLPAYDWQEMRDETLNAPVWLHFGPGNIFRGYIARLQDELLNKGLVKSGIIAAVPSDKESISMIFEPYDNMCLSVSLMPDGKIEKRVIASVAKVFSTAPEDSEDIAALKKIAASGSLQMISFTITEKGYALKGIDGEYLPAALNDFEKGPGKCVHAMGKICELLLERFKEGGTPVAVVSMDNCSHNGEILRNSVLTVAEKWNENGFVDKEFADWLSDEEKVAFPWSMIDKITPGPDSSVEKMLLDAGISDAAIKTNSRGRPLAAFVNSEAPEYLVIEDRFPNGRPSLEKAGVYFTDRDTVSKTERMKVTTCLNPLHTALAVYGCLLGYTWIWQEMEDPQLCRLVNKIGYTEGLPVVTDPGIISPREFLDTVVNKRLPNPFMPDAPQRIASDTSQKIPIRFGETVKSYIASDELDVQQLTFIPLAIAGWVRYLLGINDEGEPFVCSGDPMLELLQKQLESVRYDDPDSLGDKLSPVLSNSSLFAVDLVKAGLSEKIEGMVKEMLQGKGAVRACLVKYLGQ